MFFVSKHSHLISVLWLFIYITLYYKIVFWTFEHLLVSSSQTVHTREKSVGVTWLVWYTQRTLLCLSHGAVVNDMACGGVSLYPTGRMTLGWCCLFFTHLTRKCFCRFLSFKKVLDYLCEGLVQVLNTFSETLTL